MSVVRFQWRTFLHHTQQFTQVCRQEGFPLKGNDGGSQCALVNSAGACNCKGLLLTATTTHLFGCFQTGSRQRNPALPTKRVDGRKYSGSFPAKLAGDPIASGLYAPATDCADLRVEHGQSRIVDKVGSTRVGHGRHFCEGENQTAPGKPTSGGHTIYLSQIRDVYSSSSCNKPRS
jgi:hypothetical protein